MSPDRRTFLKHSALAGAALAFAPGTMLSGPKKTAGSSMKFRYSPYTLELKHTFTVASNSRTTTPVMLVEVEKDGVTGYGEASMPPYLGESHETAAAFLSKVNLSKYPDPFLLEDILRDSQWSPMGEVLGLSSGPA